MPQYTFTVTPDPEYGLGIVLGEVGGGVGVLSFKRHPLMGPYCEWKLAAR